MGRSHEGGKHRSIDLGIYSPEDLSHCAMDLSQKYIRIAPDRHEAFPLSK